MPRPPAQRSIVCYHCQRRFDVAAKAITHSCPACSKRLVVEDVVIKTLHSVVKLQTCGRVIIEPRGHVIAQRVDAQEGLEVDGKIEAAVYAGGPVRIGAKAHWKGDCTAPRVRVEVGSHIVSGVFAVAGDVQTGHEGGDVGT